MNFGLQEGDCIESSTVWSLYSDNYCWHLFFPVIIERSIPKREKLTLTYQSPIIVTNNSSFEVLALLLWLPQGLLPHSAVQMLFPPQYLRVHSHDFQSLASLCCFAEVTSVPSAIPLTNQRLLAFRLPFSSALQGHKGKTMWWNWSRKTCLLQRSSSKTIGDDIREDNRQRSKAKHSVCMK